MWYRKITSAVFDPEFNTNLIDFDYSEVERADKDSYGRIKAIYNNTEIGFIDFETNESKNTVRIDLIEVPKQFRNSGVGQSLYRELLNHIKNNHPSVDTVKGDIESREAFLARNKAYGQPELMQGRNINFNDPEEASNYLQPLTEEDKWQGPNLKVVHKIS
jgi:predicted GNAT family acetyltransferase